MPVVSPASSVFSDATRAQKAFQTDCVEFFAEVVQAFGVPKSVGQIYGALYASPKPLSFSDIVGKLEISKGSASQGLHLLRSLGAINEAEALNSPVGHLSSGATRMRSVVYLPELSLRRLMCAILQEQLAPLAATGSARLNRLRELAEQVDEEKDFYMDRVKQLNIWRRRLKTVLPVLTALLGPKSRK